MKHLLTTQILSGLSPLLMVYLPWPIIFAQTNLSTGTSECSNQNLCPDGQFCNYDNGDNGGGFCEACLENAPDACYLDGLSDLGAQDCAALCSTPNDDVLLANDDANGDGVVSGAVTMCSIEAACPSNQFCNFDNGDEGGFCESCEGLASLDECYEWGLPDLGAQACVSTCEVIDSTCSVDKQCPIEKFCNFDNEDGSGFCESCLDLSSIYECFGWGLPVRGAESCTSSCKEVDFELIRCNSTVPCEDGSFCNVETSVGDNSTEGYCVNCFWHSHNCYESGLTQSNANICRQTCSLPICEDITDTFITVNGIEYDGNHLSGVPFGSASGPLVDIGLGIGDLTIFEELSPVEDGIDGSVCLIERGDVSFQEKVSNCESFGGVSAIIFNNEPGDFRGIVYEEDAVSIPSVTIAREDGEQLQSVGIGTTAFINTTSWGEYCTFECSVHFSCPDDYFCNYDYDHYGYCEQCPQGEEDHCYFSGLPLPGAQSCANTCGSALSFSDCKLCEDSLSESSLGTASTEADTCVFCPSGLQPEFEDVVVPMFGEHTTCFLVDEFFRNYAISSGASNCKLALTYSFLCGCGGPGYAGANSPAKRKAFVWVPRCMAILSMIGSLLIIVDIGRKKKKRSKMNNQMMLTLSVFDFVGSFAYALTSLPIPEEDFVYGAKGNDATCTAQGFFIQLGTTAAYINVSLSIYYLMIINFKWTDDRLKKHRVWFFVCPILTGLGFAFGGIPFYTNLILWCGSGANYWPEIPILLAIAVATVVMVSICWHVYKEEQASKKWSSGPRNNTFSRAVFWQSFWYLMSFYLTWPPYLALQFLWSSGKAYSMYGFVLFAGSVVPLQGFWNCVAFKRSEMRKKIKSFVSTTRSITWYSSRQSASSQRRTSDNNEATAGSTRRRNSNDNEPPGDNPTYVHQSIDEGQRVSA